jgi:galactokinase
VARLEERVRSAFEAAFGRRAEVIAVAPGRMNVVGEHTDYNDGFVLPAAIDRFTAVALSWRDDDRIKIQSEQVGARVELDRLPSVRSSGWADYALGVAHEMRQRFGAGPGFELAIASDIPIGSGLSSSGALEVATAMAMLRGLAKTLSDIELARLCQGAENRYVGAQTGIMDQLTSLIARAGSAVFLDCRSLETEMVQLPDASVSWLLIDTRVRHQLAASGYNDRRSQCQAAAHALGLRSLRDLRDGDVDRIVDPVQQRRARHVFTENARVFQAVDALRQGSVEDLGPILFASHSSLRDDFEVSCAELDCLVDLARAASQVIGARMMGGGFGGCVLALVQSIGIDSVEQALSAGYVRRFGRAPAFYRVQSVDGVMPRTVG